MRSALPAEVKRRRVAFGACLMLCALRLTLYALRLKLCALRLRSRLQL